MIAFKYKNLRILYSLTLLTCLLSQSCKDVRSNANAQAPKVDIDNDSFLLKITEGTGDISGKSDGPYSIQYLNQNVNYIVTELLTSQGYRVKFENDPKKFSRINIDFNAKKLDLKTGRQILIDSLASVYNFKINYRSMQDSMHVLEIASKKKLENARYNGNNDGVKQRTVNKQWEGHDITLSDLSEVLSKEYSTIITTDSPKNITYSFKIEFGDFKDLMEQLEANYGLSLRPASMEIPYAVVTFL